jgi:hypothetical protein
MSAVPPERWAFNPRRDAGRQPMLEAGRGLAEPHGAQARMSPLECVGFRSKHPLDCLEALFEDGWLEGKHPAWAAGL